MRTVAKAGTLRQIPSGIWALGFVSMLADISSEIIHSLLPVFMVSVLGASALTVGLIEGAAEATALIVKVFSGAVSDYLGRRKLLAVLGYGLSALTKPLVCGGIQHGRRSYCSRAGPGGQGNSGGASRCPGG